MHFENLWNNIDNAEELNVVMLVYNLLEYRKNYKKTTDSLWNYYRDEPNSSIDDNNITHSILNSDLLIIKKILWKMV